MRREEETEDIEIALLLEAVYRRYGHDFRSYAGASIRRRIHNVLAKAGLKKVSELIPLLLHDESFFETLVYDLSVTVTEMFRDPGFFKTLRERVIPVLKTYPYVKIWHAGCATGQEVYSLAIILKEEDFAHRATVFATDFNDLALCQAREGIYPIEKVKEYTANYNQSGGSSSFGQYYHAGYNSVIMDPSLSTNITFANHNLVTDSVFSEIHLILCRNVLIYFNRDLQNRVLKLFNDSLVHGGILALGSKETLQFSTIADRFTVLSDKWRIYRKTE